MVIASIMIGRMTSQPVRTTIPAPPGASEDRADEIIGALAPLLAHHRHRWAARCQAHGVSIVGFQVLALLEMHGGLPMSRLAEELDVALPNATGIVGREKECLANIACMIAQYARDGEKSAGSSTDR